MAACKPLQAIIHFARYDLWPNAIGIQENAGTANQKKKKTSQFGSKTFTKQSNPLLYVPAGFWIPIG